MRSPKERGGISLGLELEEIFTNRGWEGETLRGLGLSQPQCRLEQQPRLPGFCILQTHFNTSLCVYALPALGHASRSESLLSTGYCFLLSHLTNSALPTLLHSIYSHSYLLLAGREEDSVLGSVV